MDRRALLKTLFGGAVVATGGAALLASTSEAEAASLPRAANLLDEMRAASPAVATETDLEEANVENVQWGGRCWRNRWGEVVCRRGPPRRVIVRRPIRRRCWRNRWGQIVCAY